MRIQLPQAAKINSLSELVKYDTNELLKFRNRKKKSLVEIEAMVLDKGLQFEMDLLNINLTKINQDVCETS